MTEEYRPVIVVAASSQREARRYVEALAPFEAELVVVTPGVGIDDALARMDGLLLTGGADVHPSRYGELPDPNAGLLLNEARDAVDFPLLDAALTRDLPVVGICRGLQVLNVACGGTLLQHVEGHRAEDDKAPYESMQHRIWITPGSKLASIVGAGGNVRVNSIHHQGLTEARRRPRSCRRPSPWRTGWWRASRARTTASWSACSATRSGRTSCLGSSRTSLGHWYTRRRRGGVRGPAAHPRWIPAFAGKTVGALVHQAATREG